MIIVRLNGMVLRYPTARFLSRDERDYTLYEKASKQGWVATIPFGAIIESDHARPEATQQAEMFE